MRIGILFPSIYASEAVFPDKIFAPKELCTDLANGLVDRGHDVTVYSVPDFPTRARLVSEPLDTLRSPLPYYKFRGIEDRQRVQLEREFAKHTYELRLISRCFADANDGKFDLIHVYHDSSLFLSHYLEDTGIPIPVVYTLHDPLPPEHTYEYEQFDRFSGHRYVSISNSFRHSRIQMNFVDTVYHGIDPAVYPFNPDPADYLLFLGRQVPEKGLHSALEAAISSGEKLVVSTNFSNDGTPDPYFDSIKKQLHHPLVTKLGVVSKKQRIDLYQRAKALLFPIEWEEPFGVVLIEAMACGTPVIAYGRGSVPEIVSDGVTGFILNQHDGPATGSPKRAIGETGISGLVRAIQSVGSLDRNACRKHVEDHFRAGQMVEGYERVYSKVVGKING